MSLTVVKAGLLDTIQDLGRYGFGIWGINPGGAMDRFAAQIANALTGNDATDAVFEMHFPAPQILFDQNAMIAITGADFTPILNDQPVNLWQPILVRRNTILQFTQLKQGACCYLSVHGGFAVSKWLNSHSTNTRAAMGGFSGRKLEKGDQLKFGESRIYHAGLLREGRDLQPLGWRATIRKTYEHPQELFFIAGREWNQLHNVSQSDLLNETFTVHSLSDRMGYHLRGLPLTLNNNRELLSSAVSFGTMQLLPNGQIIVLMADHQTTGGYPRIGHIITAHLPKFAQLRPGAQVRFTMTDIKTAEELYISQQREIAIIRRSSGCNLNNLSC